MGGLRPLKSGAGATPPAADRHVDTRRAGCEASQCDGGQAVSRATLSGPAQAC